MSISDEARQGIPPSIPPARRRDLTGDDSSTTTPAVTPIPAGNGNPFAGKFYSIEDVLSMPDNADWLFPDLLCRGDTIMLFGDSGAGKTFVALDIAFALAAGKPWCNDRFIPVKPHRVLYCVGEGFQGFRRRVKALHASYQEQGIILPSHHLRIIPLVPQLFSREDSFSSQAFMNAHDAEKLPQPDLIIIDTMFRAILGADENSAKDATFVIEALRQLVEHTGAAVMLVHHISRGGNERGSTAYRAAMESAIELKRNQEDRCMICRKLKDGEEFPSQRYALENNGNSAVVQWLGDATSAVVASAHSRMLGEIITAMQVSPERWWTVAELATAMGKDRGNLTRSLKKCVSQGLLLYKEGSGRANPTTYRVHSANTSKEHEDALLSLSLSDNDRQ